MDKKLKKEELESLNNVNKIIEKSMENTIDILGNAIIKKTNKKLESKNGSYRIKKKTKKKNIFDFYEIEFLKKK